MKKIKEIPGLYYIPECITEEQECQALEYVKQENDEWNKVGTTENARRNLCMGYEYNYMSKDAVKKGLGIKGISRKLRKIAEKKCREIGDCEKFNQCIVNEYHQSQGIGWHIDASVFGDIICCFTVGGATDVYFRKGDQRESIIVEPRSLYIMSGESREEWEHSIPKRKTISDGRKRETRWSFTYRHMKVTPEEHH